MGEYRCLIGESITSGELVVKIDADGKGTYQSQPFTWTYDGTSRVEFAGDVDIVSGQFKGSDPLNEFIIGDRQGVSHWCVTRSR